jgi:uncharacterized protein YndB with AHSA1/START domain
MTDGTAPKNAIVIERVFDAPVEFVWKLWTHADHFQAWYGPDGFNVSVAEMDVRVGGKRLVCMEMQTPDGRMKMWTTGEYTEVVPHERLVYTESMADENGNVISPSTMGMSADEYPETTKVTILLEDLDGRTRMVMTHAGVSASSGANEGWEQAFAKLAKHIETVRKEN